MWPCTRKETISCWECIVSKHAKQQFCSTPVKICFCAHLHRGTYLQSFSFSPESDVAGTKTTVLDHPFIYGHSMRKSSKNKLIRLELTERCAVHSLRLLASYLFRWALPSSGTDLAGRWLAVHCLPRSSRVLKLHLVYGGGGRNYCSTRKIAVSVFRASRRIAKICLFLENYLE